MNTYLIHLACETPRRHMLYVMGLVARAGALDAVERHDAVLECDFKLGFGLLHLLLADVGLR